MNRFELFKRGTRGGGENPMQRAKRAGNWFEDLKIWKWAIGMDSW
jgi:hypothetical protein